jgi:hypothetical protein
VFCFGSWSLIIWAGRVLENTTVLKCFANSFPCPAGSNCPFVFIYGVNEHKKGQFEPAGLGKLIEKQFRLQQRRLILFVYLLGTWVGGGM